MLFKRGLRNSSSGVHPLNPEALPMVGPAFTLRYIPAREDLNRSRVFEDRSHPQRRGVEECPPGARLRDRQPQGRRAASAGDILITRLWKRGVAGIVTDGGFRDSPEIAKLPIPAYHRRPAAPTNLTPPPGRRPQCADRLRRRAGLSRRYHRRRCRGCRRHSRASCRRDRGRMQPK